MTSKQIIKLLQDNSSADLNYLLQKYVSLTDRNFKSLIDALIVAFSKWQHAQEKEARKTQINIQLRENHQRLSERFQKMKADNSCLKFEISQVKKSYKGKESEYQLRLQITDLEENLENANDAIAFLFSEVKQLRREIDGRIQSVYKYSYQSPETFRLLQNINLN